VQVDEAGDVIERATVESTKGRLGEWSKVSCSISAQSRDNSSLLTENLAAVLVYEAQQCLLRALVHL